MYAAMKLVPLTSQSGCMGRRIRSVPILLSKRSNKRGVWGWGTVRIEGREAHPLNFPKGF